MEIVWLGYSCFRLRAGGTTVITDPCPKSTGYNIGRVNADIVTVSHEHENHSHLAAVQGHRQVLRGPGEYEVAGVYVVGVRTYHDATRGAEHGSNTCFVLEMDEVRVCHLGDLGHALTAEQLEPLATADVLLVPVGGGCTIDAVQAAEVVSLIEPRIIVPMHYGTEAGKDGFAPVDKFLREMGVTSVQSQPKLTATRGTLPDAPQVVVLDYRG